MRTFISAILAGAMIGIGGTVYLCVYDTSAIVGALFFSLGLLTVLLFNLHLYTGKVGYLLSGAGMLRDRFVSLLVTLFGNTVGAAGLGFILSYKYVDRTQAVSFANLKLARTYEDIIISSIFCGVLMFMAVHGYKRANGGVGGVFMVIGSVATFILCGFEHSIADIFYFALAGVINARTVSFLIIAVLGNAIGSIAFSTLYELKKTDEEVAYAEANMFHRSQRRHHHSEHHSETNQTEEKE